MTEGDENKPASMESSLQLQTSRRHVTRNQKWHNIGYELTNIRCIVHGFHLQRGATVKDFDDILDELYKFRRSRNDLEVARLALIVGIIIFCSDTPIEVLRDNLSLLSDQWFYIASYLESLLQAITCNSASEKLLSEIFHELKLIGIDYSDRFHHQGKEVRLLMLNNISSKLQQELLPTSLATVATWFLTHFPENETRSILQIINPEDVLPYESFAYLLVMWLHIGYPGNSFFKNVGNNLPKMFRSSCLHLGEDTKEADDMPACTRPKPWKIGLVSAHQQTFSFGPPISGSDNAKRLYYRSSGRKLHFTFPWKMTKWHPLASLSNEETSTPTSTPSLKDSLPLEFLSFFRKALKKDVEYLASISDKLAENAGQLMEFRRLFENLLLRHGLHSNAKGQFIIPAVEAKTRQLNISLSYTFDHELEAKSLDEVSVVLDEMIKFQILGSSTDMEMLDQKMMNLERLRSKLSHTCQSFYQLLSDHICQEETELWPLFSQCFSVKEQDKITASVMGRTSAETLQDIIPWLISCLTPEEQQAMMSSMRRITKSTMFDDWLDEWWQGYGKVHVQEEPINPKKFETMCAKGISFSQEECLVTSIEMLANCSLDVEGRDSDGDQNEVLCSDAAKVGHSKEADCTYQMDLSYQIQRSKHCENHLATNQDHLGTAITRESRDTPLDVHSTSQPMNKIATSQRLVGQQNLHTEAANSPKRNNIPGQHPSYRDSLKQTFGCRHYKRSCKLVTACCNQLYTCIRCHDEAADHSAKRRAISEMMCMKCLVIQPIGQKCSTASCCNFSMAKYYCSICKLFDDERDIYHCPYCNLCRVGKGLGIDYFHCMNCNACMSQSLSVHICREKCFEDNCPICHEYIFTSSTPVKALACGHLMHSTCFKEYTCTHYTCPICSKSLGDMQVYFQMLDEMLAAEEMPQEYSGKNQAILCNDCEKKGSAAFHWVYHKCSYCGSYNTRLI